MNSFVFFIAAIVLALLLVLTGIAGAPFVLGHWIVVGAIFSLLALAAVFEEKEQNDA